MNAKLTKGLAAAAISAAMMLGAAAPALAQGVDATNKVNLVVKYDEKGVGVAPEETITYGLSKKTSSDNATYKPSGETEIPDLDISTATVNDNKKSDNIVLTVPDYQAVGKYTYTFTRNKIDAAGVTDNVPETITVLVTVENNKDGFGFNKYVNIFNGDTTEEGKKIDHVDLEYASGQLMVKKLVSGNLGDTTGNTKFDFNIELHGPADKATLSGIYHYAVNGDTEHLQEIPFNNGSATLTNYKLGHNDYITFTDLPAGVTYTVSELKDSNAVSKGGDAEHGYTLKDISTTDNKTASTIDAGLTDSETYTNDKTDTGIDTGVLLNNAPYIAILGGAAVVAIYVVNKRRHSDMD